MVIVQSEIIASAVECCGQKQLRMAEYSKKRTHLTRMLKKLFKQRKMHSRRSCRTSDLKSCRTSSRHLICNPGTPIIIRFIYVQLAKQCITTKTAVNTKINTKPWNCDSKAAKRPCKSSSRVEQPPTIRKYFFILLTFV